jgi:DNA-directed RNA polymerase subunit M/transcription elongation factor TFIIS
MQAAPPRVCPRCRGSMILEEDWYGSYSSCLSCGYVYEFGAIAEDLQNEEGSEPHRQRRRQPSHGKLRL